MKELIEIMNLKENRLICIGGKANTGKKVLLCKIAKEVAINHKIPVVFFSLETSKECVNEILEDVEILSKNSNLLQSNIVIKDIPAISIEKIKEECIKLKNENNIGLIVIDYLQLIQIDEKYTIKEIDIALIINELKLLSNYLNIPIIITSQLNKEINDMEYKNQKLIDLYSDAEQNLDLIMLLCIKDNNREIIIYKDRYGKIEKNRIDYKKYY